MEKIFGRPAKHREHETSDHWMSVSDLMSGLMIVFLFISIALMRHALIERDKIKEVAITYQNTQGALFDALITEFEKDLGKWNAEIDKNTLSFKFKSPDILFGVGSFELKPLFRDVLADFFPRYMKVLNGFKSSIDEVRIEGHTSSNWSEGSTSEEAYFRNMELSQARTRSVLFYTQKLPAVTNDREWIKKNIAAVGFSSSRLILDATGAEDPEKSRRVTFRVITNAETQIRKIIED
ncbi:OmpA family protein [Nitrosospira sp. Nsp1]|uniref:OmpA/MotB family protein n=1 Tax=Nitrosospira sp. Nsp1 TaxID=136547 RepID=UPI0008856E92|nr:OmpA family protein [Nitrosospira sp. Nsp1]SCX52267.1 OmpA family protein [Nitrosospira sp. Nsp1]